MAIKGWRVTDTYIRCVCDAIGMSPDCLTVFEYHPVVGEGYIKLPGTGSGEDWGDNVIPIEYDRFKTRVELLSDLGYSVMFIATKLGTTEEEVRKIVGKDYIHKDYSEMRSEYFMLINENSRLCDEVRSKKDEIETLEGNYKALRAKHNGIAGANACGEDERKKLIEENARLSAALKSEEEANDILTKRIAEANNEIDDLKRQCEMLQAKLDALSGITTCWNEENKNLTKQLSDLRSAYYRIYRSRDEHIKHNEALECKVKELTTENEEQRTIIKSLTEYKDSWREEALRYKEELATAKAKHADAMRCKNGLEYRVSALRAEARDYKKRYEVAKSANSSLSDRYEKLITQRDMAIRLLFTTHDYDEIADALHIPESLAREIVKEE